MQEAVEVFDFELVSSDSWYDAVEVKVSSEGEKNYRT